MEESVSPLFLRALMRALMRALVFWVVWSLGRNCWGCGAGVDCGAGEYSVDRLQARACRVQTV